MLRINGRNLGTKTENPFLENKIEIVNKTKQTKNQINDKLGLIGCIPISGQSSCYG